MNLPKEILDAIKARGGNKYNIDKYPKHRALAVAFRQEYESALTEGAELALGNTPDIVRRLADWSRKYPRGRGYSFHQMKMDEELIEIEEAAKLLCPPRLSPPQS